MKADGSAWECTFVDDFNGGALDRRRWVPEVKSGHGTVHACYVDDPRTVSVSGGALRLSIRPASPELSCPPVDGLPVSYVAGSVTTWGKFAQQYGRFEARIQTPFTDQPGLHEAFWLWPAWTSEYSVWTWPEAGEIDIAETYSQYPNLAVPFLHYGADGWTPIPGINTAYADAARGQWHTYTLEWTADLLEVFVDGRSVLVNRSADPAFDKNFVLLLTQALGTLTNAPLPGSQMQSTMLVDYVKVWR